MNESNLSDLPPEMILQTLSHMKSSEIVEYCKINRHINTICKLNRNLISRYALQNNYGFNNFPSKYDYSSIMSYMNKRFKDNNQINYKEMLKSVIKDHRMDVLRFLVVNGVKDYEDAVNYAVVYDNYDAFVYFIEDLGFDITKATEDAEFYFNDLCIIAFTNPYVYQKPEILEYIIKNYRQHFTQDFLESVYYLLLEGGSVPLADYVQLIMDSDSLELPTVSHFLETYMD
jgi:hypothetical protein